MRKLAALLLFALAAPAPAQQINPKDVLSGFALRNNFRDRRLSNTVLFTEQFALAEPNRFKFEYTLTSGIGYSDAGGGVSTTSLPQELEIDITDSESITTVLFDIDAYDWLRSPNRHLSGIGDPSFEVGRRLWCSTKLCKENSDSFGVAGAVTVPSGTEASAGTAGQTLKLLYGHTFVADKFKAQLRLDHIDDVPDGISKYLTTGKVYWSHNFDPDTDVFVNAGYSYQSGIGAVTTAGAGVDFAISKEGFGPFSGVSSELSGTCVLSGSHHCGRVELDFILPFN